MGIKKILIANYASLLPKVQANQERVVNMVKRLSQDHIVDVATTVRNAKELSESRKTMEPICNRFFPIKAINPSDSQLRRKFHRLNYYVHYYLFNYPELYYYASRKRLVSALSELVRRNRYDIVQAEYWFMGKVLETLASNVLRVIDTHDVLFEKRAQELRQQFGPHLSSFRLRELAKYTELEIRHLKLADLILSISTADSLSFSRLGIYKKDLLIPIGQDIEHFRSVRAQAAENVILFYGSMGDKGNIDAFFRFWTNIFPHIKDQVPDAKVLLVGANPPDGIKMLEGQNGLAVTGFVDDVRPYLSKAKLTVLPLDVAAGFRSRVVDVMAMGIPVIGTHKALDCLLMESGLHGFITDSDREIANCAIELLTNTVLRDQMGENCIKFVSEKYSIEATYGALSKYYLAL